MKTLKWKRLGFFLAIMGILTGNLIGISALATEEGTTGTDTGAGDAPAGVLVGYRPSVEKVKTGEHIEYYGWAGVPVYARLVTDYSNILCCKRTYRAMDGCKGLKICPTES